jgi:hypothetical protein
MSIDDVFGVIRDIVGFFKPIIEPILEIVNVVSGIITLVSFLEGFSLNAGNTSSLLVFVISFLLMAITEEGVYEWLKSLVGL